MVDSAEINYIIDQMNPTSWDILLQLVLLYARVQVIHTISTDHIMCDLMKTINDYLQKTNTNHVIY